MLGRVDKNVRGRSGGWCREHMWSEGSLKNRFRMKMKIGIKPPSFLSSLHVCKGILNQLFVHAALEFTYQLSETLIDRYKLPNRTRQFVMIRMIQV